MLKLCHLYRTSRRRHQHNISVSIQDFYQKRSSLLCRNSRQRRQHYLFDFFVRLLAEDVNTMYAFAFFAGFLAEDANLFVFSPKTPTLPTYFSSLQGFSSKTSTLSTHLSSLQNFSPKTITLYSSLSSRQRHQSIDVLFYVYSQHADISQNKTNKRKAKINQKKEEKII